MKSIYFLILSVFLLNSNLIFALDLNKEYGFSVEGGLDSTGQLNGKAGAYGSKTVVGSHFSGKVDTAAFVDYKNAIIIETGCENCELESKNLSIGIGHLSRELASNSKRIIKLVGHKDASFATYDKNALGKSFTLLDGISSAGVRVGNEKVNVEALGGVGLGIELGQRDGIFELNLGKQARVNVGNLRLKGESMTKYTLSGDRVKTQTVSLEKKSTGKIHDRNKRLRDKVSIGVESTTSDYLLDGEKTKMKYTGGRVGFKF